MKNDEMRENGEAHGIIRRVFLWVPVGMTAVIVSVFAFVSYEAEHSRGIASGETVISFEKGETVPALARDLKGKGIIRYETPFLYHLWKEDLWRKLQAGDYLLSGDQPIAEIALKIVRGETVEKGIKITFPEGWTAKEMAARLDENGFSGERFLELVNHPKPEWQNKFSFLVMLPKGGSLEGFLFPDTYYFDPKLGEEKVIEKILENFGEKTSGLFDWEHDAVRESVISTYGELVLSSIVEAEVRTETDRKMVADLFLRRLEIGQALQSDATVRYALGVTKIQHSAEDIAIDSPYNTYKYPGLPPGPIGNPGFVSIRAVVSPESNLYWYFLNNPETGATVFSTTFEEHVENKAKNGL